LSPVLLNFYTRYLNKEALKGFGDFKIGGKLICNVKYADNLVVLAKKGTVLQGITYRLTEVGRCFGMEMNVDKSTILRTSKQPFTVKSMIGLSQQKQHSRRLFSPVKWM
jgi:hypothetical protein